MTSLRRALRSLGATVLAAVMAASLLTGCGADPQRASGAGAGQASLSAGVASTLPAPVHVVAAGDIACPPGKAVTPSQCQQQRVADLVTGLQPDVVLPLGDNQYEQGTLSDYRNAYDKSWGGFNSKAWPVPGNHEYYTAGASGYYTYFQGRTAPAPGYYRKQIGSWQVYFLNSNCSKISCSKEATWLAGQMNQYPAKCSMIVMHHPRFSTGGEHGDNTSVTGLWKVAYNHRADVAIGGHDHDYERFIRQTPGGAYSSHGILSFVSGSGGKNHYPFGPRKSRTAYRNNTYFGVLDLQLDQGSFSWSFRAADGTVLDPGSRSCV